MPFRSSFSCLWCGTHHDVRGADDLEGWAALCPDCMGRADDNGFLRARLRSGLQERSAAATSSSVDSDSSPVPQTAPVPVSASVHQSPPAGAEASRHDDWYLRRGPFSRGPIIDEPWQMELDAATRWLDAVPLSGIIVELAAGSGWWSTLLASKGELWMFEPAEAALEQARQRLVAHGLLAHLHVRDPLGPPDKQVDSVFAANFLAGAPDSADLDQRLAVVRGWLATGGTFAFIEPGVAADQVGSDAVASASVEGPAGQMWPRDPAIISGALIRSGLVPDELTRTHSAFVMGTAKAP